MGEMIEHESIRQQVRRAIWLDRTPHLSFLPAFLQVVDESVPGGDAHCSLEATPAICDARGELDVGAFLVLADLTLAMAFRPMRTGGFRIATVNIVIDLTGLPITGKVDAVAKLRGLAHRTTGRIGHAEVELSTAAGIVGYGSGTFMLLPSPGKARQPTNPMRHSADYLIEVPELDPQTHEAEIIHRAEAALLDRGASKSFLSRFWDYLPEEMPGGGAQSVLKVGQHMSNRAGHVHGGVLCGLAAHTAQAAVGNEWILSRLSASFLSPGNGSHVMADARVVHAGGSTAVTQTLLTSESGRTVMDVSTTFFKQA